MTASGERDRASAIEVTATGGSAPRGRTGPEEASFFVAVGGEPTFRRLVDAFYAGIAEDPLLRPMYPEETWGRRPTG